LSGAHRARTNTRSGYEGHDAKWRIKKGLSRRHMRLIL